MICIIRVFIVTLICERSGGKIRKMYVSMEKKWSSLVLSPEEYEWYE
jgi:hypothetical protein